MGAELAKWIAGIVAAVSLVAGIMTIFGIGPFPGYFGAKIQDVTFVSSKQTCEIASAEDLLNRVPFFCAEVVIGADLRINQPLTLVANTIDLGGHSLHGPNGISIYARQITNGRISANGDDGPSGPTAGAHGENGRPGGLIRLVVGRIEDVAFSANGGTGGTGAAGGRGQNGRDGRCGAGSYRGARNGGTGLPGGNAGRGGEGGEIRLYLFAMANDPAINAEASAGGNGLPGVGGPGGSGGSGCTGLGGSQSSRSNGSRGPSGDPAPAPPEDRAVFIDRRSNPATLNKIAECIMTNRDDDFQAVCVEPLLNGES